MDKLMNVLKGISSWRPVNGRCIDCNEPSEAECTCD